MHNTTEYQEKFNNFIVLSKNYFPTFFKNYNEMGQEKKISPQKFKEIFE